MKMKTYDDDGRTIADMNVDGMPWYHEDTGLGQRSSAPGQGEQLTKEQQRHYTWAAVKAGLFVVLVYGGVFAAFIALCDFFWQRMG